MKTSILFSTIFTILLFNISVTHAQTEVGRRCGDTTPAFCVGEKVAVPGYNDVTVTAILSNGTYQVTGGYYSAYGPHQLAKTKGCTKDTNPRFCAGESIAIPGYLGAQVVGVLSNNNLVVRNAYYAEYPWQKVGKTKGCSNTTPRFCAGEPVGVSGYDNAVAVGFTAEGNIIVINAYYSSYPPNQLGKKRSTNSKSIESLGVYLSTDTTDIVESYTALASVSTRERAEFLTSSSAYLKQLNAEDVNIFAGLLLTKIIRLSTSQAVKDHFEKPALTFEAELAKNNWKSIDQIEANMRTLDYATRVIYAAVKLKLTLAQTDPKDNGQLAELGQIAAMTQLSRKLTSLQAFCEKHRHLIEDLIQDPRHGVLGMVAADAAGWIISK